MSKNKRIKNPLTNPKSRPLKNWEKRDKHSIKRCLHCNKPLYKSTDCWSSLLCEECLNTMYQFSESNTKTWTCERCGKVNSIDVYRCSCERFVKPSTVNC